MDGEGPGLFQTARKKTVLERRWHLVGVSIEHLSWNDFIKRYDKPGTLFYCDPPYYKSPVPGRERMR